MKKGWLAVALLAGMLALSWWHVAALDRLTSDVTAQLRRAEELARLECWEEAAQVTREAVRHWRSHDFYLHVTLHHESADAIAVSFAETLGFLESREPAEYAAANARLMEQLALLGEMERPTLENLL